MEGENLNVIYIGSPTFPVGYATTKRRRYMIDYMNNHNISSHYLVCDFRQRSDIQNPIKGRYGICEYYDITHFAVNKNYIEFWKQGKRCLQKWFVQSKQNVLIFTTIISLFEYPFYLYARKLGYKIVFDQVETSYLHNGKSRFLRKLNVLISEWLSDKAYQHSDAFVISKYLWSEVHKKYPQRKLCLLPNSTPQFCQVPRKEQGSPLKILYSGTFSPKDGVEYLLDGVIEAYDAGANIELALLGKGTKKDMDVLEKIKDKEYIHYLGFVSDEELIKHLIESDVLCMTRCNSRFANYGFPFKLSEYLATGNVVLATNVGDVCEYVKDKESAYIVPPEDSHAIASAIRHIETHPQEALRVAEGGLKAMQQHFSIEKVGKVFVDFLNTL